MLINNNNFILKEIPKLNPLSQGYKNWWKEQMYYCVNGYWSGGKWMPGNLYFYINFWHIRFNETDTAKNKSLGKPSLRDIEWEVIYYWMEARGFSRFENQKPEDVWKTDFQGNFLLDPSVKNFNYRRRIYKEGCSPRELLRKIYKQAQGRPLFENQAKNFMIVGSRGFGKSFTIAGAVIGHEFTFKKETEIVVGAGDAKYSSDLLKKVKIGLEFFEGGQTYNGEYFPSPLHQETHGSWESSKTIEAYREFKVSGTWMRKGRFNSIKHVSFKDKPEAAVGTRPSILVKEEIGFFNNLLDTFGPSKECMMNGSEKFGSEILIGTGGDMLGGTNDAEKMFYDPENFDLLIFDDEWEGKGKIAYFVPAWMGLNQFKDENGISNKEKGLDYLIQSREQLRLGKDRTALDNELQFRPIVPSEIFLRRTGNMFPTAELKLQLAYVENDDKARSLGDKGLMARNPAGKPVFEPNPDLKECDYPVKSDDKGSGCVVIWEYPMKEDIPFGLYIAGIDPYAHDESTTTSLGSTLIYKRFYKADKTYNWIVAEYTGRPESLEEYYEQCRLLLEYYNATAMYENQMKGLYDYFKQKFCTHLLADQPDIIKDIIKDSKVNRVKGIHMSPEIKNYAEILVRDWLKEEYAPGKLNLNKIYSIPLLKELIKYHKDANFDRVDATMMLRLYNSELFNIHTKHTEEAQQTNFDDFFKRRLF